MYLGMVFVLMGWGCYLASVYSFSIVILFVLYINHFQIKPEERALTKLFSEPYSAYKRKVGRWF